MSASSVDATSMEKVTEGQATILFEKGAVFYNEVQVKNRDLSVLVLNAYAEQVKQEAIGQVKKRKEKLPWRRIPPTWNTWGPEAIEAKPNANPVGQGDFKEVDEKKLDLDGV